MPRTTRPSWPGMRRRSCTSTPPIEKYQRKRPSGGRAPTWSGSSSNPHPSQTRRYAVDLPPRLTSMYDVLVLGSGVAGLTTALQAARRGLSVLVLTKGELSHSATRYAQGGVAAALAAPDAPALHLADTLTAGAGLCDVEAVRILVNEGPECVREL